MNKHTLLSGGLLLASWPALAGPPTAVAPPLPTTIEFIANHKQWASPVLFAADVPGGRLFLENGRLVQSLLDNKQIDELQHHYKGDPAQERIKAHAYSTTFVGASPLARVSGLRKLPGHSNYFLGNDKSHWASRVPGYGEVRYAALYPGIDLHFYSKERELEYDFEVAAGADASRIELRYDGQTRLQVIDGALHIGTSVGTVVEQRPYAYQVVNGQRQRVACEYALSNGNTVTFALPKGYNRTLPLVIDPVLSYASYTGSSANNYGYTATYDSFGNLYSGGVVFSAGYPTTVGAYSTTYASGQDIGIMKFNPAATSGPASRVYATYIGGSSNDHPHSLVVDGNNNLIVLGSTDSPNYPTTTGAISRTRSGTSDITLSKLDSAGATMVGSTYFGGTGADGRVVGTALLRNYGDAYRGDVTIDPAGNIYIASITQSANYPVTAGVFQATAAGVGTSSSDGVVTKFNPGLTSVLWSSYIGGSGVDAAYSVQLDSLNNVFVSGGTTSANLPGTTGAYHSTYQGGAADGFVSRISADGSTLVRTTYLGTAAYDQAYLLQLNKRSEVYAYGQTLGAYPVSAGVYTNSNSRQFIQKLDAQLTTTVFSTVVGNGGRTSGDVNLSPTAFLVDNCGQIIVAGWGGTSLGESSIAGLPVTPNAIQSTGPSGDNHYILQLSANAQTLVYGTYYGNGNCHVDGGTSRFDKKGIIYQAMCVGSASMPILTTPNTWAATKGSGSYNNAAFKIDILQLNADFVPATTPISTTRQIDLCAPATFYFNRPSVTGTSALWDFGNGQTSTQNSNVSTTYLTPGRYPVSLTVFDTQGCLPSITTRDTVVVYGVPQAVVAANANQTICSGATARLSATNGAAAIAPSVTYTWTAPGQPTQTGASITVRPATTTVYTVTLATPRNVGGCSDTATVTVTVRAPLTVSAGPAQEICARATATLTASDLGTGATYTWTAPNQPTLTGRTVTVTPTANIRYRLNAVDGNGCTARDSVQITITPLPSLAATANGVNLINNPVQFTNTSTGATSYVWDFGDGSPTSTEVNPAHVYTTTSTATSPIQAKLTGLYGPNNCEESVTVPVVVRGFELPNIITPNGDGKNDAFKPFVSTGAVDVQIFNRWGRKVFEQSNYTGAWGDASTPAGTYFYRITNAAGDSWKGWVEVVQEQ